VRGSAGERVLGVVKGRAVRRGLLLGVRGGGEGEKCGGLWLEDVRLMSGFCILLLKIVEHGRQHGRVVKASAC
jgi:hypothetical protein